MYTMDRFPCAVDRMGRRNGSGERAWRCSAARNRGHEDNAVAVGKRVLPIDEGFVDHDAHAVDGEAESVAGAEFFVQLRSGCGGGFYNLFIQTPLFAEDGEVLDAQIQLHSSKFPSRLS